MRWIANLLQPVSHTSAVAAYQHGAMQTQINDKHTHTHTRNADVHASTLTSFFPLTTKFSNEAKILQQTQGTRECKHSTVCERWKCVRIYGRRLKRNRDWRMKKKKSRKTRLRKKKKGEMCFPSSSSGDAFLFRYPEGDPHRILACLRASLGSLWVNSPKNTAAQGSDQPHADDSTHWPQTDPFPKKPWWLKHSFLTTMRLRLWSHRPDGFLKIF